MTCSEAIVTKLLFIFLAVQKESLTHAPAGSNAACEKHEAAIKQILSRIKYEMNG
jgi:hypothetical protein